VQEGGAVNRDCVRFCRSKKDTSLRPTTDNELPGFIMNKKIGTALVVGAGISGIRSALDLAEQGYQVKLIDKAPNLGGVLTQLDYQFPSDHCGMCKMLPLLERDASSQFCLRKGLFHENIDIMLSTELVSLDGEPGRFQVTLRQKATMVDASRCIGCGECARVCPVEVPDSFNAQLTRRKAIYLPVPHTIPNTYLVDVNGCTLCGACVKVCPTNAIDFGKEARKRFRILVVDDELVVRDSLKEWLADEGFLVDMAESGTSALEKMGQHAYHLMLLDIKMPGMDGVEALKRAKEMHPALPVVMMTAYGTVETAVEAMKIGALDYLMKPFDPDALVPVVVRLYQSIEKAGEKQVEVGAVVLAAGFESFNPASGKNLYGYGHLPNVVTSIEFERLVSGTGPNGGVLLRPSDGKPVTRVAWLQCVGSRAPQEHADFCSSACCMFAIKEAVLAKERTGGQAETTIFYMDMRTFGKDFQRYRDRAEKEKGVRFVRSRIHTIEHNEKIGDLTIVYVDQQGTREEESFDLVVLSAGQRPQEGSTDLAEKLGIELNPWGFSRTDPFSSGRSTREGITIAGSYSGLRDISESVIQAGGASLEASRLLHAKGGSLAEEKQTGAERSDVSRERPSVSVTLCHCGGALLQALDAPGLVERLKADLSVRDVQVVDRICTQEGWQSLCDGLGTNRPNRILIGACMPYLFIKRLRDLADQMGLESSLLDVVDIRSSILPTPDRDYAATLREVTAMMSMALGKLKRVDPSPVPQTRVIQKALVVGGGIAGMTSALAVADHGFEVSLVERQDALGGNLRSIYRTIEGESVQELLTERVARIEKHPRIKLYTGARVVHNDGRVGRFSTVIERSDGTGETLDHGVTILATGGREAPTTDYCYGQCDAIVTQHELERKIEEGLMDKEPPNVVAMIQCVGSREEPRNYCSRVCCSTALKNAIRFKEARPETDVFVLYRDIMAYGFLESYYTKARRLGVVFVPFHVGDKPGVKLENGKPILVATDPILGRKVRMEPDLLVLSTGIVPDGTTELADLFGVEVNRDGFFQEAESKWRPVDFVKEGIFTAGIAHSPRSIGESIVMAGAAAQRALRILSSERITAGHVIAQVRSSLCSRCERCIDACPYGARWLDEEEEKIVVHELMCQGCGSCAAVCPNGAAVLHGLSDMQVFDMIDAALESPVISNESAVSSQRH
jgi:heterodisulfide reductase subunit A